MNPRRLALALSCLLLATLILAAARVAARPAAGGEGRGTAARSASRTGPRRWRCSVPGTTAGPARGRRRDVVGLGRLYTAGSRSGRHDRALLEAYADRGLRVRGLRMQVLAVDVRSWSSRRLVLVVTDRLAGWCGRRASASGCRCRRTGCRRGLVTFVRAAGEWRVAEVQARAATRTASTWRSTNR